MQRLKDQYIQLWNANCSNSSKLITYNLIKQDLDFEPYLDMIQIKKVRRAFTCTCFRISAHSLMIEKGRYICVSQNQYIVHIVKMSLKMNFTFHLSVLCILIYVRNTCQKNIQ